MARRLLGAILVSTAFLLCPAAAGASMITEFAGGLTPGFSANVAPTQISIAPDGNLWFTEHGNPGAIAYIDRSGVVHEFTRGLTVNNGPWGIAAGPDGNVWFTEFGTISPRLAYVDHSGVVHEFAPGLTPGFSAGSNPYNVTTGPDGHVWFTEGAMNPGRIAYIDGAGVVHEFATTGTPYAITSGPGGHVWFTESSNPGRVGYIDGNGVVHEYAGGATIGLRADRFPAAITTGPDGHIWFAEMANPEGVAYIDDAGVVHEFTAGNTPGFDAGGSIVSIATGRDGNLWFAEYGTSGRLGRVNFTHGVPNGTVTEFQAGDASGFAPDAEPDGITTGPDGHIWFTDFGGPGRVGRVNGPDAVSGAGAASGRASAILSGTVNANGTTVTDCHFDFGSNAAYGASIPCAHAVGGGTSDVAVSADIGSLLPGGTYHFRVVATNAFDTSFGSDQVLTVPALAPSASTGPAVVVGLSAATATGTVVPNGASVTDCHFDYGTTTSYGWSAPCTQQVGSGNDAVSVSATLAGLTATTTYHVRLVATNSVGTAHGGDVAFMIGRAATLSPQRPVLSQLRLRPSRFPAAGRRRDTTGTTISYHNTTAATTTFTIERCVTARRHRRRRCTALGTFTHFDRPGINRLHFSGRAAGKPLSPSKYTLVVVAAAAGMRSQPATAQFEVTR